MMTSPNIVSGAVSTVTDLGKDEAWLQEWLKEEPARLGLGELGVADGEPVQDDDGNPAFLAADDDDRFFSVDVRLGELDASHGFQLLDNWARNRVRHPDKTHVAVLVTETVGDRYRTTLDTLAEHLPLVVVELRVWRGETEAIVVPYVALSSDDVELKAAPAVAAADAVAHDEPETETEAEGEGEGEAVAEADVENEAEGTPDDALGTDDAETAEAVAAVQASSENADSPDDKDNTGVADPWRLPNSESEAAESKSNGSRLLSKIGG
jgi:hypothetical protein